MRPAAYYNEIDPFAAQWLRNLSAANLIMPGEVDERPIQSVDPPDLIGFSQCHFFAGIGVWSYALRLAGWPDDRPVWTGSCPCQPFSAAGKRKAFADERHLWPYWSELIRMRRPVCVIGEQVASPDGYAWLDTVSTDLESAAYAFGACISPAAGFGAPHGRHRIYFMAYADGDGCEELRSVRLRRADVLDADGRCATGEMGNAGSAGRAGRAGVRGSLQPELATSRAPVNGFWRDAEWIPCADGKARPIGPGTFPLAHGSPARVGRLRAYGNAIVAPQAAEFIKAAMECMP